MVQKCTCKHAFQDAIYGPQMRVHTQGKDGAPRCTVCGPKPRKQMRVYYHALEFAKTHWS